MEIFSNKRYHNRITLIYDAGSAIGKSTVLKLAERGSHLILAGSDENEIIQMEQELQSFRSGVVGIPTEITNTSSIKNLLSTTIKHFARLDHVIITNIPNLTVQIGEHDSDGLKKIMDTNFSSVAKLLSEVVPMMYERGSGKIIVLSSYMFLREIPVFYAQAAAEFALLEYLISLGKEIKNSGLNITVINLMKWRDIDSGNANIPWYIPSIKTERIAKTLTDAIHYKSTQVYIPMISSRLFLMINRLFPIKLSNNNYRKNQLS
jgi:short-subunit dehydrogenase